MATKPRPAIITRGLTKRYGKQRGIENLNLKVERGEVFGFLGPNGSGKSTTINLLMGFRRPSSGSARILGQSVGPDAVELRRKIGYMPGELALYERLRGRELLKYFGDLRGGVDAAYVTELADRFGLDVQKRIGQLSKGNKQKVALIAAFMHRPEVLILDEPTSGLDPLVQQEFHELLRESKRRGVTIFLSSHVLSEVEHICDRAAIIKDGRLVAVERIASLHSRAARRLEVTFAKRPPVTILARVPGVTERKIAGRELRATVHGPIDPVVKALARQKVSSLTIEHASLEALFFEEYGEMLDA